MNRFTESSDLSSTMVFSTVLCSLQTHPEHVRGINEAIRPNLNSSVAKPVLALDFLIDAGAQVRGNDIAAAL